MMLDACYATLIDGLSYKLRGFTPMVFPNIPIGSIRFIYCDVHGFVLRDVLSDH